MRLRSEIEHTLHPIVPLIDRPRLAQHFAFPGAIRVVVLLSPAGFGKSAAVRSFLSDSSWLHYRVGRERVTFARFVRGFAQAVAPVAPGAQASFPRAWERALQSGSSEAVLARWLCEHLQDAAVDIVIDDLHEAGEEPRIAAFLEEFVRIRAGRRLAIAARVPGQLPIPLWMATGVMNRPIDQTDLRFDLIEARAVARDCGGEVDLERLVGDLGACPVGLAYAVATAPAGRSDRATLVDDFESLADRIFTGRSMRERQFLLSASLLPSLRPELLEGCGWSDWSALCAGMQNDAPFMWEVLPNQAPRFYDRFADYLAERFLSEEPSLRIALAQRAVYVLQRNRCYADALSTAVRQGLASDVDGLLDKHGFQILESGHVDEIAEALSVVDASNVSAGAVAMALRGYVDANFGRFDTAESWFQLSLVRADNDLSRVTIALYYARVLMQQFRDDAFSVLEPYADSQTLPNELLIDVRSSLGQAYMIAGRAADGTRRMAQAMQMLQTSCPATLRARVLARAAYVAFEDGDAPAARRYALLAAPIAVAEGLYDVATSVYTVLYTIAYEFDDDPQSCLEHLALVRHYGMKSGTIRLDLYALVATYELYAEAGDRKRLTELDQTIGALDVKYATNSFLESFLPARALQASWAGDFAYAYSVLAPTADQQATALRKALRWSEVALYAAASGDRTAAVAAGVATEACLAVSCERTNHLAFATLNCALTSYVLGDIEQARRWEERARDAALPGARRVHALRAAVAALLDGTRDPLMFTCAVQKALDALHAASFGGCALLIESLPLPRLVDSAGIDTATIGERIAAERLNGLYRSALESTAGELRLFDWLRAQNGSDFESRSIARVLLNWTPPPAAKPASAKRVADSIHAFANTRRAAPAFVATFGREDDVDARIDSLFADLKIAAPLMAEHSQAVSAWCTRIARRLGLDDAEIAYVTRCGLMHDIGKVTTPAAILEAPRRLEPHEWEIMRDHAAQGGRMAAAIPALHSFIPVIRGHHERLDGKGYPDGLRAGAIPLAARIVTVADCFNAMIGRRPYRLPMSPTDALAELDRNRHTQFDPEVVAAMVWIVLGLTPAANVSTVI